MEGLTAWLEGPGCFVIVWAFLNRHPMRYALQFGVSLGQYYGKLLSLFSSGLLSLSGTIIISYDFQSIQGFFTRERGNKLYHLATG